jgi:hypothetical protein
VTSPIDEPERPTFREWLEANSIQQQLTPEQWDAMMERDRIDMDMRFMNFSVIGRMRFWDFRHDLWKRYGTDTGASISSLGDGYTLTWPEALRTNYQEWERP